MIFKRKPDWVLLAKYMAGETDAKETESVLSWAENKPGNKALFNEIKSDWHKMNMINERFDVDKAWEKLHGRILVGGERTNDLPELTTKSKSLSGYFSIPVRIAASLLLLAILGVAVVTTAGKFQRVNIVSSTTEQDRVVKLPDGSTVFLNSDSKLSFSKKFGKSNRDISLTGEAYFEVSPDKENPFRIYAGNALVKVVGTEFNVNTRKSRGLVEVYVESGIVELSENGNLENSLLLHSGNTGIIEKKSINMSIPGNANAIAWKTGVMTFVDAPLLEVIELLNNVYNVKIKVEGEGMDTIRINGSYQDDLLEDILSVISQHNPQLTIAKPDDTVYLSQ